MKPLPRYLLLLAVGMFAGLSIGFDRSVHAEKELAQSPLPLEDLKTLADVFGHIKSDYVESIDDKKLLKDAIQGMLAGLDPHSSYLDPDSYKQMQIGTEGQFGGLGIEVTMENGFVKVVAPIDDTPAWKAGIKAGDIIIKLDDKSVKGMSLNDAVDLMRGKPGTDIVLTVVREGRDKPFDVTITRDVIRITSVRGRLLEKGYAYIRISQFQSGTAKNMRDTITRLKEDNDGALKGLVLDLRNNPGGVLHGAVDVADIFLTKGTIVHTKGRTAESEIKKNANPEDYLNNAPMVVLINSGSASASEIVAGALQDHQRAIVMGTKSFGKGSVQTIIPMSNGAALKLTTARYYTPNDRSIQATGINPDIVVEDWVVSKRADEERPSVREKDLTRHLDNKADSASEPGGAGSDSDASLLDDYQLNQALIILKGISLVKKQI